MQIQSPISLVYPSPPAPQGTRGAGQDAGGNGVGARAASQGAAATGGAAAPRSTTPVQEDAKALSLQDQLELGKNRGLFAHITYTRDGRIGQPAKPSDAGDGDTFAREAANVMREFSQDLAALKGEAPPTNAQWGNATKPSEAMANKLRASLQSVANKLHVFA